VPWLLDVMDRCGVRAIVNLDGMWGPVLEENLDRYDRAHPGRFATFCQLDWSLLAAHAPGRAADLLVRQLEAAAEAGARGVKVWKELGLLWRDQQGALVLPDDPRVAAVFARAGELGLPVLIHTADPVAFFEPVDACNERIGDLAGNPEWWFGGPGLPSFERLMDALEAVVGAHPATAFIGAHVGCFAEDLRWVGRMLGAHPNLHVDLGGRMPELGRQPRAARKLILDHPGQVVFGTDQFPVDEEAYHTWFRFLETADEAFPYAPGCPIPPMGRWDVSALDLPAEVLPALYADNILRLVDLG
jgi:predicted TIM-barrel fold metal-dependent hydrolase